MKFDTVIFDLFGTLVTHFMASVGQMHKEMAGAMKKIRKMGGLGKLASMFGGGLGGMMGGGGAGAAPPGGLPGLPGGAGGGQPFNLPPGFDKFLKK